MEFLEKLSLAGLVPVIAINDAEDAVPLCKALAEGGLPVAEITFRTAAAEESIRRVHEALPDVLLCAGTVLTTDQVDRAVKAGAAAIVSPGLNPEVVKYCIEKNIPVCPGTSNPSDIEVALSMGLKAVKVFPAEAIGGLKLIKSMAAPYVDMKFMPTGGINENNMLDYLAFDKILCCGGSWMVPGDAVAAKDWGRITALTRSAVDKMLGFEVRHIGINCEDAEASLETAKKIAALMGWPVKEGNSSNFVGTGYELMKKVGRGAHGHIAIGTNSVARAKWHLEQRGFKFIEDSAVVKNGKLTAIYVEGEIGGFAFHLVQK
ncbi:MAG: bifunctional 4-hydroxy-2-oxoglutarate aldolase/2-dehydro-3-deoxy-phosphogluconate aldolase [Christensenellaceae bacterium]|nr:bifunctional 4-hydroxy-2-oxoglutarate aldolase/2-dehydro-3-deoxy-phosphogluconate aldolase [Christensenellaceae bacterium]